MNSAEKAMGELRSKLEFVEVGEIIEFGLHEYLDSFQLKINRISLEVNANFFTIRDSHIHEYQSQNQS